ncbi:hypothetical protein AVANS14531_02450 [Campylobacter sp. Cr9]|uniref:hypothetical protein n=1 Tax=Campylobacter sp. Cr9 TaxID=2735728 RepID=UPI00301435A6|nr:hypothetical protein [Campylobacter sp. Cr9]
MKKYTIKTFIISIVASIIGSFFIAPVIFLSWTGGNIVRDYLDAYDMAELYGDTSEYYISYIIAFAITFAITSVIINIIKKRKN